ncbi:MAG: DUF6783 domain-containing protein [Ruminococcus sp.]
MTFPTKWRVQIMGMIFQTGSGHNIFSNIVSYL